MAQGVEMSRFALRIVAIGALNTLMPLLGQTPASSEADEALRELQILMNTPIESASKRKQKSAESPQAVEVLMGDQIRASGAFRLMDLLRLMTNIQVYDMDGQSSRIAMRGIAPNSTPKTIQVLVDGVALYNSEVFPMDIEGIPVPLEAIERVEVVRGPSSSLYGANAQLGVISITTKRGGTGSQVSLHTGFANNGGFHGQGAYQFGNAAFGLTAGFGTHSARQLEEPQKQVGSPQTYFPQNQYHQQQVMLRPEYRFAKGSLWAMYAKSSKRTGPETAINTAGVGLYTIGTIGLETEIAQAGWAQDWTASFKSTLKVNRTRILNGLGNGVFAYPGNPASPTLVNLVLGGMPNIRSMEYLTDVQSDEVALQVNWDPSEAVHFVFGGDTRKMKTPGSRVQGIPAIEPTASGGFVSMDWNVGPAILSAGVRAENETLGGSRTSPRLALVVPLDATSVVRAGYFTSTRSPQMTERYASLNSPVVAFISTANPDLKPEEAENLEVGYRKNFARWSLDVTAYHMKLKKFIASTVIGVQGGKPLTQFRNAGTDLTNKGLEVGLKGEVRLGWLLGLNATYLDYRDDVRNDQQYFAPRTTANLWTRAKSGPWFGYLALQNRASFGRFSNSSNKSEEEAALFQMDFNLGYEFAHDLTLSLYGVNAAHAVAYTGAAGFQNQFLTRYARRELGIQAAWRF